LNIWLIKLKKTALDRFSVIFAILTVLLIFSLIWTYMAYSEPVYRNEQVIVSSYTHSGNYGYAAPVTLKNPLYPTGTRLGMGEPAYFLAVSPTMDASFIYSLTATDSADLTVESKTLIIATSRGSVDGEKKIFWQKKYPLGNTASVRMQNGETLTHSFTLDIPEIQSMVKYVQDGLKYSQDTTIEVVTYVSYQGTINGKAASGVEQYPIPLTISSSYYQLPEKVDHTENTDAYETRRILVKPSLSTMAAPLLSSLFSIGLVIALGICRIRCDKLGPSRIRELEIEHERAQFAEWISSGTLPGDTGSFPEVDIASLKDLNDVAVDINSRVIHDADAGVYFIIHSGVLYSFRENVPEQKPADDS